MSQKAEQGQQTAARLLSIARARFISQGYAATTTSEIIAEAGVTKGALYHHFDSKQRLFEAVYRSMEEDVALQIQAASQRETDPFERLMAGCSAYLRGATEDDARTVLRIEGPAVLGHARWREIDNEFGAARLQPFIEQLKSDGILRIQDAAAFTVQLTGAMNEATFWIASHPNPKQALRRSLLALRELLEGVREIKAGP